MSFQQSIRVRKRVEKSNRVKSANELSWKNMPSQVKLASRVESNRNPVENLSKNKLNSRRRKKRNFTVRQILRSDFEIFHFNQ